MNGIDAQNFQKQFKEELHHSGYYEYHEIQNIKSCVISENEKYLATRYANKLLIIDLKKKKKIFDKEFTQISQIQFSLDSKMIIVRDNEYKMYCYQIRNKRQIFKMEVQEDYTFNMVLFDHHIILGGFELIQIVNLQQRKITQILNSTRDESFGLAIDFDKVNKIIVAGFFSGQIKCFKLSGKLILEKNRVHDLISRITQLQLAQKNNYMFSCNFLQLKLLQIDYQNKIIIEIRKLDNCQSFNLNYNMSLVTAFNSDQIVFLDNDLQVKQTIKHNRLFHKMVRVRQQLNYLVLLDYDKVNIFKRYKIYNQEQ